jgi:hypothetical protein
MYESMKRMFSALLLATVLCGCGTGYVYSPYIGQQQNWPTQVGGYVKVIDKVTVYPEGQFPNRPYTVIGSITTGNDDKIAKAVRDQQADAAIIINYKRYRTGTLGIAGPGSFWDVPLTATHIAAQLIKFR